MMDSGVIYRVLNTVNNKCYIGYTTQVIGERLGEHVRGRGSRLVKNALSKYGIECFRFDIIEDNVPQSKLKDFEKMCIKAHDCIAPKGYNLTEGGDGVHNPSDETREKMSKSNKTKGENHPFFGKKLSVEHRQKISRNHGKPTLGKPRSPEVKDKISKSQKGRVFSEEHKQKMRKPKSKKRVMTESHRRKISEGMKKVWAERRSNES